MVLFSPTPKRRREVLKAAKANARTHAPLSPLEISFKITLRDHDLLGHFTNTRYHQLAALSREAWMIRVGIETGAQRFLVAVEDMTFIKMMRAGQSFTMQTQLESWNDDTLVFRHDSHKKAQQTGTGLAVLQLSSGPLTVPDLLKAHGVTGPAPKTDSRFRAYLK